MRYVLFGLLLSKSIDAAFIPEHARESYKPKDSYSELSSTSLANSRSKMVPAVELGSALGGEGDEHDYSRTPKVQTTFLHSVDEELLKNDRRIKSKILYRAPRLLGVEYNKEPTTRLYLAEAYPYRLYEVIRPRT